MITVIFFFSLISMLNLLGYIHALYHRGPKGALQIQETGELYGKYIIKVLADFLVHYISLLVCW